MQRGTLPRFWSRGLWPFDIINSDPTLGRAEALRRAMLADLDDPLSLLAGHPTLAITSWL